MNENAAQHHLIRYERWINYYAGRLTQLGADRLFLIDDGGSGGEEFAHILKNELPDQLTSSVNVYRFNTNMGRRSYIDFPGWWRSFLFSIEIARKYGYKKIIHLESDFFVLSERLQSFIASRNSGWTCLYSRHYDFPETCMQVICEDAFYLFDELKNFVQKNNYNPGEYAEKAIPFTNIEKEFIGDRLGDHLVLTDWLGRFLPMMGKLDFIGQMATSLSTERELEVIRQGKGKTVG
jgi:hypothetical protein